MIINNVNELSVNDTVQYIGNTLGHFTKIGKVVSVDSEKNQCHISFECGGYLTRCDAANVIKLKAQPSNVRCPSSNYRKRRSGSKIFKGLSYIPIGLAATNVWQTYYADMLTVTSFHTATFTSDDIPF